MVHKGKVVDFAFNPFNSQVVATAAEDAMVKINVIPEGGLKKDTLEAAGTLEGHGKKMSCIAFHPTASNVLASAAYDNLVKLWDIETQQEKINIESHTDAPFHLGFNSDGSLMASTCKDRKLRVFDARALGTAQECEGFGGNKSSEVIFVDKYGLLFTSGFNKGNMRQYAIYDQKKMSGPVSTVDIDASAGTMCTYYDPDLSLIYLAGKGDANIKFFELTNEAPYCFSLSSFNDNVAQKGFTMMPKTVCDVKKCEVGRGIRLLGDVAQPISFIVPRKTELFQADIFPDTYAYQNSASASDFFSGTNGAPVMRSMNPKLNGAVVEGGGAAAGGPRSVMPPASAAAAGPRSVAPPATSSAAASSKPASPSQPVPSPVAAPSKPVKTAEQYEAELAAAYAKIASLEAQLAEAQN